MLRDIGWSKTPGSFLSGKVPVSGQRSFGGNRSTRLGNLFAQTARPQRTCDIGSAWLLRYWTANRPVHWGSGMARISDTTSSIYSINSVEPCRVSAGGLTYELRLDGWSRVTEIELPEPSNNPKGGVPWAKPEGIYRIVGR